MNNSEICRVALWVFVCTCSFYTVYGLLIRRRVMRDLRRRIRDLNDRVELMIHAGAYEEDDPVIGILRKRIHRAHGVIHKVAVTNLALAGYDPDAGMAVDEYHADEEKLSSTDIEPRIIAKRLNDIMFLALLVNSPLLTLCTFFFAFIAAFFIGLNSVLKKLAQRLWASVDAQECEPGEILA